MFKYRKLKGNKGKRKVKCASITQAAYDINMIIFYTKQIFNFALSILNGLLIIQALA